MFFFNIAYPYIARKRTKSS